MLFLYFTKGKRCFLIEAMEGDSGLCACGPFCHPELVSGYFPPLGLMFVVGEMLISISMTMGGLQDDLEHTVSGKAKDSLPSEMTS